MAKPEKKRKKGDSTPGMTTVRFPIALKLILASVAIILLLTAAFVAQGLVQTQQQYKQFADTRKDSEISVLIGQGLTAIRNLSDSVGSPMLGGETSFVLDLVTSLSKGNPELGEIIVANPNGKIWAATTKVLGTTMDEKFFARLKQLKGPAQLTELTDQSVGKPIAFGSVIEVPAGDQKRLVGYAYLEMSTARVVKLLEAIEAERKGAVRSALVKMALLALGALLIGIIIAVLQGLRFGRAIRHLSQVADEVGRGNLEARAIPTSQDEIGVLCVRFNDMTSRVDGLLRESMEKAALDQELERANAIQSLLMPSEEEFRVGNVTYCGLCEPASQMGGDWWHHYQLDDHRVLLCIGDVTGHGIPSAMLTASTKACCDTFLYQMSDIDLPKFMQALDYTIRESGKGQLVMTFFAGLFDLRTQSVEFVNAGHNFPINFRGGKIKSLVARGSRLGDGAEYESRKDKLERGDLIVFYTDGILECENAEGEEYGLRRFRKYIEAHKDESLIALRDGLMEEANAFYGDTPRKDDITLVFSRIEP